MNFSDKIYASTSNFFMAQERKKMLNQFCQFAILWDWGYKKVYPVTGNKIMKLNIYLLDSTAGLDWSLADL